MGKYKVAGQWTADVIFTGSFEITADDAQQAEATVVTRINQMAIYKMVNDYYGGSHQVGQGQFYTEQIAPEEDAYVEAAMASIQLTGSYSEAQLQVIEDNLRLMYRQSPPE